MPTTTPPPAPPAAPQGLIGRRPRLTLALALLLGLTVMVVLQNRPPKWEKLTLTPVVARALAIDEAPRIGAARPDVRILVYTDYQCPACKSTDAALERLVAADPGVQVVYKDWPVLGELSVEAARIALAAHHQGRYLAVHRALMANRTKLSPELAHEIAIAAGVDARRLEQDRRLHAAAIQAQLARNANQAWALGIGGTPGYLVGPFLVRGGLNDRDLKRAVRAARKAGPPR